MSNLYEITGNLLILQEMLEETVEDDQHLVEVIEAYEGEYEDKLEAYCKIIKNLESDVEALKSEADRLTNKRKILERNVDRLKSAMFDSMKATDKTKIKGKLFTISIQRNGGKIPVVMSPDAKTEELPDDLVIFSEKPNLDAIREQLEMGKTIEGFSLGERGESLRIK